MNTLINNSQQATQSPLALLRQYAPTEHSVLEKGFNLVFPNAQKTQQDDSLLTRQGNPIEWAYVWPSNSLRFSADPLPGASPKERTQRCLDLCQPFPESAQALRVKTIIAWQSTYPIDYGAWIGVKAKQGALKTKLYLEIPATAPWQSAVGKWTNLPAHQLSFRPQLTMIGIDPTTNDFELYFSLPALYPDQIGQLQQTFGMDNRGRELLNHFEQLDQRKWSWRSPIPSADIGCSVAYTNGGQPKVFTLYCFAHSLLGNDATIRRKTLAFNQQQGFSDELYQAWADQLPQQHTGHQTHHGMVGLAAANQGPIQFTIGISLPNSSC